MRLPQQKGFQINFKIIMSRKAAKTHGKRGISFKIFSLGDKGHGGGAQAFALLIFHKNKKKTFFFYPKEAKRDAFPKEQPNECVYVCVRVCVCLEKVQG